MKKLMLTILAAAIVGMFTLSAAQAAPIEYGVFQLKQISVVGSNHTVHFPNPAYSTITVRVGEYQLGIDFDSNGSFEQYGGYCIEDQPSSTSANDYTFYYAGSMGDDYRRAAWIMGQGGYSVQDKQVAIWEMMLGSDGLVNANVTGDFSVDGTWANAQSLYEDALDVTNLNSFDYAGYFVAISEGVENGSISPQDFIVYAPDQVPVPAAVWLLGSGLLGLIGLRRRKR